MGTMTDTIGTLSELMGILREAQDRSVNSLTEYTKKTQITSRAYVEEIIAREDGIKPIINMCNHIYGGLIFATIGMNNLASGGRTVRQMVDLVSTEEFHTFVGLIKDKFGDENVKISVGNEGLVEEEGKDKGVAVKEMKLENRLFAGRLVEITIPGAGKNEKIQLYFYVQILPYVTPTNVLNQFIDVNFKPSTASRWAKFKAGEIKFWRDFVFECDLIAKRRKALKADKQGILREMEERRSSGMVNWFKSMSFVYNKNHNSASSIIIISRRSLDRIMKDKGMDYRRFDVRQKIMTGAMCMMMAVYDPDYGTVELYMNGFNNVGQYSIDQLKDSFGKGDKDSIDLKTLMTILQSGNPPRF